MRMNHEFLFGQVRRITAMKKVAMLCIVVLAGMSICLAGCSEEIYNGQVSGSQGGKISAENLEIILPAGISNNNINLAIYSGADVPEIQGTERQREAYEHFRFIGPIYKIEASPNQFRSPFYLTLKIDSAELSGLKASEILNVVSISDNGILEFPAVFFRSRQGDLITIMANHFSDYGAVATDPATLAAFANAVTANNRQQKYNEAIEERDRVQREYEQLQKEYEATMARNKQNSGNQRQTDTAQVTKPTPPPVVNIPVTDKTRLAGILKEYADAKADYDAYRAGRITPSGATDHNKIAARYQKAYQAYVEAVK